MKHIQIQYSDDTLLAYNGYESWDELPTAKLFRQLYRLHVVGMLVPFARFIGLRLVYGIPERISKQFFGPVTPNPDGPELSESERRILLGGQLLDTIRWIWQSLPAYRWHIPHLRLLGKHLHGPGDGLAEMTFGQFMFVERYFMATREQTPDYAQHMRLLLAALYLPAGKRFDKQTLEARARWMRAVPKDTAQAIRFNYEGLRHQLTLDFPEVYEPPTQSGSSKPKATSAGWLDVALGLAGDDIGKLHDYENANLFLMMKVLQNACLRAKELEKLTHK